ncbi:MAG: hypothetical protein N2511_06535 [Thermodesulfovibrionales bacterium]|nr:hypothetical protein [Thermodesulfovibrionales bacterium]
MNLYLIQHADSLSKEVDPQLPHLSKLASLLLCGDAQRDIITFKRAGVVCLKRFDNGVWSIQWMVIPEIIKT